MSPAGQDPDAGPASPRFAVWVRRSDEAGGPCAIRFEVYEGKGVLRVARPGVLIVPPARTHGFEDHLTADQLRESQFLHIPRPGARRTAWSLAGVDDDGLALLDSDVWYPLRPVGPGRTLALDTGIGGDVIALGGSGPEASPSAGAAGSGTEPDEDPADPDSALSRI
ncbi:MAG: hypothetical protein D6798_16700, partial [Deltaproteobacteria bacterium]